ncbi:DUF777 family protein [Borrelia turicatae]|uniref:DUF777 family protein n=1 Tax=Borrelia turicatae (strain 91E135) TaxID=314724 RepID=A0ABF7QZU4_BORT9|nr:DUF777 family protein [Borrelia turicatae]ASJ27605.1 hypothetical protein BT0_P17 [Borrelia turicatae 91E135]UPA13746.1 DUF777 family protein [Borrelia turicatae 91E135]
MNLNYEIYRMNSQMKGSALTQEEIKLWTYRNIFISKLGIIKSFNSSTQEGVVLLSGETDLEIKTRNISNMHFTLSEGERVILLQSSINLFNEDDDNYFDKNYFYILRPINMQNATIKVNDFTIDIQNPIDIKANNTSLRAVLEEIVSCLYNLRVTGQSVVEPSFYSNLTKITSKINMLLK